jgi:hypothetical protein
VLLKNVYVVAISDSTFADTQERGYQLGEVRADTYVNVLPPHAWHVAHCIERYNIRYSMFFVFICG